METDPYEGMTLHEVQQAMMRDGTWYRALGNGVMYDTGGGVPEEYVHQTGACVIIICDPGTKDSVLTCGVVD